MNELVRRKALNIRVEMWKNIDKILLDTERRLSKLEEEVQNGFKN